MRDSRTSIVIAIVIGTNGWIGWRGTRHRRRGSAGHGRSTYLGIDADSTDAVSIGATAIISASNIRYLFPISFARLFTFVNVFLIVVFFSICCRFATVGSSGIHSREETTT